MPSKKKPRACGGCGSSDSVSWHRQRGNNKFFCDNCQARKLFCKERNRSDDVEFDNERASTSTVETSVASESGGGFGKSERVETADEKMEIILSTETTESVSKLGAEIETGVNGRLVESKNGDGIRINSEESSRSVKIEEDDAECDRMTKKKSQISHPRLMRLRSSARPTRAVANQVEKEKQSSHSRSSSAAGGNGSTSKCSGSNLSLSGAASTAVVIPRNKSRRHIFKLCKPEKAPSKRATVSTHASLWHKGRLFRESDVVAVIDENDENVYYALIRGLLRDQYCQQFACLTWLVPTTAAPADRSFDIWSYVLGPEDETFYPLDSLEFICHIGNDYFKRRGATLASFSTLQTQTVASSLNPQNQFVGVL